jgi:colanic acid/amylovoran biosynthesis glycosyltransferase
MPLVKKLGVKHVVTFYGHDVNRMPKVQPIWVERYQELFQSVSQVLCEGPHMATCLQKLGCPPEKVAVHHLGVALDSLHFEPRQWKPGTPLRVLIAASFKEKKGIPYALRALGELRDELSFEVTVIGDASDDAKFQKEKAQIYRVVEEYGLAPRIRFLGYRPHSTLLEEAYKHHVFLSPSVTAADGDTEGGAPVSVIEMAASGMLVVSTFHCDIPAIIKDGETGLLAEERNVDQLCQKIWWLTKNPTEWMPLLENGRKHIEEHFNAQVQGGRLSNIYEDIANKRIG